ncbi:hypothetical protein ACWV95_34645 [Streptomyces albus]
MADGRVQGRSSMYATRGGALISNGSFMVAFHARGRGDGPAPGEGTSPGHADRRGVRFKAVVECAHPAVTLWVSLGFEVVGTVPGSFHHPSEGCVGPHVRYQQL